MRIDGEVDLADALDLEAAIAADAPDAAAILGPSAGNGQALELTYAAPAIPRFLASSSAPAS